MSPILAEVQYFEPWWIQIVKAIVIFAVGLQLVPVVLIAERKLLGRFQGRYGPNRVGPYGALQPLADILKLLTKEQFRPTTSVGFLFANLIDAKREAWGAHFPRKYVEFLRDTDEWPKDPPSSGKKEDKGTGGQGDKGTGRPRG